MPWYRATANRGRRDADERRDPVFCPRLRAWNPPAVSTKNLQVVRAFGNQTGRYWHWTCSGPTDHGDSWWPGLGRILRRTRSYVLDRVPPKINKTYGPRSK